MNLDDLSPKQMWKCNHCGTARQWGHWHPDSVPQPLLRCEPCGQTTRHSFHVTRFAEVIQDIRAEAA